MENASKALIIAGAVLISILLISLGVMIYRNAADIASGNQMKDFEITAFNTKFSQYEGKKNGSQVKTLVQDCLSSNVNDENVDRLVSVYFLATATETEPDDSTSWPDNKDFAKPASNGTTGYILGDHPDKNCNGGNASGSQQAADPQGNGGNSGDSGVPSVYTTPKTTCLKNGTTYNVTMHYSIKGANKGLIDAIIVKPQQ